MCRRKSASVYLTSHHRAAGVNKPLYWAVCSNLVYGLSVWSHPASFSRWFTRASSFSVCQRHGSSDLHTSREVYVHPRLCASTPCASTPISCASTPTCIPTYGVSKAPLVQSILSLLSLTQWLVNTFDTFTRPNFVSLTRCPKIDWFWYHGPDFRYSQLETKLRLSDKKCPLGMHFCIKVYRMTPQKWADSRLTRQCLE